MSHEIEYQAQAFVIGADVLGLDEPRYVVAAECGPSNLTQTDHRGRERRVRQWSLLFIGTGDQVLAQATRLASACLGGDWRVGGRSIEPEGYIRRVRRLLRSPRLDVFSHITLSATLNPGEPATAPLVARAGQMGLIVWHGDELGRSIVRLFPLRQDGPGWAGFFTLVEPLLDGVGRPLPVMGQVFGLPSS